MEKEPPLASLPGLQYQSDRTLRVVDVIQVVARWCIVVGAVVLMDFALQLLLLAQNFVSIKLPSHLAPTEFLALAAALARLGAGAWLVVSATRTLRGQARYARSFWISLTALLAAEILLHAQRLLFLVRFGLSGAYRVQALENAIEWMFLPCIAPAILLTIVRMSAIRESIEEFN